jgi:hypothetical protein
MNKGPTHGNIPRYNGDLGSGSSVAIPGDVGFYEFDMSPIGADEFGDLDVSISDMLKGSIVFVAALALEEDQTRTSTINTVRDTIVAEVRSELNACLRGMTLGQMLRQVGDAGAGGNPIDELDCVDPTKFAELDIDKPIEDVTYAEYLEAYLTQTAKAVALQEEGLKMLPFAFGLEPLSLGALDYDDVVGFDFAFFSWDQIRRDGRPQSFEMEFRRQWTAFPAATAHVVEYKLLGKVGRCHPTERSGDGCAPFVHPSWRSGRPPY